MDIKGGLLAREINRVAGGVTDSKRSYRATVIAGGYEYLAVAVTRLDIASDFEHTWRDQITVTLLLPLGTLVKNIAPYQDDLMIRMRVSVPGTYEYEDIEYRAYLMEDMPNDMELVAEPAFRDFDASNRVGNVNVGFSLTLPVVEYLDSMNTGAILRQVPPFSVLKVLFSKHIEQINLTLDEGIRSITMSEPSNYEPRPQISIPHNTRLVELPDRIQNRHGGVYSAGMGFYLSRRDLYFWPLYGVHSDQETGNRLHLIFPVSQHSTILDSTYRKDGRVLTVLSSGRPKIIDNTLGDTFKEGDSVRYVDGRHAFDPIGTVEDSTLTANRAKRLVETTAVRNNKRVPTVRGDSTKVTSNIYREMSNKARITGIHVIAQWRHSNHYLIKPGMLTTIFLASGDDIREIPAVVVGIHSKYELENDGIGNPVMLASSAITLFVSREDWRQIEYRESGMQPHNATMVS